ncbi:hypothetical protein Q0812_10245 [Brevundimonas sp. 2R-24]|uniref:HNH endonuclease n=1 Tax=Peiella sedimenti TaxID=3061083 RepID=A0ABT8SNV9_9CAUL|nr:hypothetical protein [Caulobacteraceae bacterium XZ-24]
MSRRRDNRSAEARAYRKLYGTARWRERRREQLTREPLCRFCLEVGEIVQATVADHVIEHRGDPDLFWFGDLQSLCATHHNAAKQRIERGGYDCAADLQGYPLDPHHPANRR